jgi:CRP/FNR family transcriptional regulator, cyclic AMP receptor protein
VAIAEVCEIFHNPGQLLSGMKDMHDFGRGFGRVQEKWRLLRNHFLLQHLGDHDLERIAAAATYVRFRSNEPVFRQGESEPDLMIIVEGRVRLSATSSDGQELLANIVERGHIFGEIAVIDGKPRSYDATAVEDSEILIVKRQTLIPFLQQRPDVCLRFMETLCERLRRSETLIQDAVFLHVGPRLARQLLRLAGRYGRKYGNEIHIDLALSQNDLASLVGMTRESINKQLCNWRQAGIISFKRRRYKVLKLEALKKAAEPSRLSRSRHSTDRGSALKRSSNLTVSHLTGL